jgi:death-on-curing protein
VNPPVKDPIWINPNLARMIHLRQLTEHGGQRGIRDTGLLEAALARPQHFYEYDDPRPDIIALAAVYMIALIQNHPFIDGNIRTGLTVGLTFLELNELTIETTQAEIVNEVLSLATGNQDQVGFTVWMRSRVVPLEHLND